MTNYGVIALKLEFLLSIVIFLGGGALVWHDGSYMTQIFMIWTALVTFWFTRRSAEQSATNLIDTSKNAQPIVVDPQLIAKQQIKITEQPRGQQPTEEGQL